MIRDSGHETLSLKVMFIIVFSVICNIKLRRPGAKCICIGERLPISDSLASRFFSGRLLMLSPGNLLTRDLSVSPITPTVGTVIVIICYKFRSLPPQAKKIFLQGFLHPNNHRRLISIPKKVNSSHTAFRNDDQHWNQRIWPYRSYCIFSNLYLRS